MKRAIVLSGGGSKGAYQIGVWRALKKLDISYDIVTGTSVGALNAALMVQKDYMKALWLWFNMNFKLIFHQKIDADYNTKEGKNVIFQTYKDAILSGGMNIERLEHTVSKALNIKKIYKSSIDLGIVTVKIPSLKPALLRKMDIPKGQLKDYLIASASCFPAFQKKKIGSDAYIDGGLYDNLPINLAVDMGATEVIAVDLKEIGFKRKVKNKEIPITVITPNNDIGSFLVFDKTMSRRCMKLGYNDAMKVFQSLDGVKFTFKKGHLKKNYNQLFSTYLKYLNQYLKENQANDAIWNNLLKITVLKHFLLMPDSTTTMQDWNREIESLGKAFQMEETRIYDIRKWNQELIGHYRKLESNKTIEETIQTNRFKKLFHNSAIICYLCELMMEGKKSYKKLYRLALLFPHEFLQAIYMRTIIERWG